MSSEEIQLLESERKVANAYLVQFYPGHYKIVDDCLRRLVGPTYLTGVLTDSELVAELEQAFLQMESRSKRLEQLLDYIHQERRECDHCGELFRPHRSDQRFCPGGKCGNAYHSRKRREG